MEDVSGFEVANEKLLEILKADSISKEQKLHNKNLESLIKLRENYANKSFYFMICYVVLVFAILVLNGFKFMDIGSTPLVALVGTISASMILFGWVLKGLFKSEKQK